MIYYYKLVQRHSLQYYYVELHKKIISKMTSSSIKYINLYSTWNNDVFSVYLYIVYLVCTFFKLKKKIRKLCYFLRFQTLNDRDVRASIIVAYKNVSLVVFDFNKTGRLN